MIIFTSIISSGHYGYLGLGWKAGGEDEKWKVSPTFIDMSWCVGYVGDVGEKCLFVDPSLPAVTSSFVLSSDSVCPLTMNGSYKSYMYYQKYSNLISQSWMILKINWKCFWNSYISNLIILETEGAWRTEYLIAKEISLMSIDFKITPHCLTFFR